MSGFGTWLRERRVGLRMSVTECALRGGMAQSQWSRMETSGMTPTRESCHALARGLGVRRGEVLRAAGYRCDEDETLPPEMERVSSILRRLPSEKFEAACRILETAVDALAA